MLSPDSDRAAIMAAETRTVAGGSARAVATSPMPAAIGRYQVVGRIGEGGMGVVYEAVDPELKRRVAVKVVRGAGGDAAGQGRLVREAQAMAQLSHASVVPVFDVGALAEADGGGVFIAMELVEGQTLRDWLKGAKRPWKAVVANLVAAGRGLAAAHAAGIVHRDFKPANVLVGMDGRVRVTDFGLARVDDAVFGESDAAGVDAGDGHVGTAPGAAARETRTGAIAGTPGYLAPEALDGVIDARGDQFAFCVSLYEGLYGERPFDAGSGEGRSPLVSMAEEVKRGAVREPPRGAKVPGWLRAMVLRGLAADPAARWPSMTALLDAIERVPRRRRQVLLVVVGVVITASVAAGASIVQERSASRAATTMRGVRRSTSSGVWDTATRCGDSAEARLRDGCGRRDLDDGVRAHRSATTRWSRRPPQSCRAHAAGAQGDLRHDDWDIAPVVSPDGKRFAFLRNAHRERRADVGRAYLRSWRGEEGGLRRISAVVVPQLGRHVWVPPNAHPILIDPDDGTVVADVVPPPGMIALVGVESPAGGLLAVLAVENGGGGLAYLAHGAEARRIVDAQELLRGSDGAVARWPCRARLTHARGRASGGDARQLRRQGDHAGRQRDPGHRPLS